MKQIIRLRDLQLRYLVALTPQKPEASYDHAVGSGEPMRLTLWSATSAS
jgi:hypothetical protein